ncbi:MAG: hypothetical protein ABI649_09620, partial [Gaiellaceae bacterium]
CRAPIRYHADGSITPRAQRFLPERAQSLARAVEEKVARVRANLPSGRVAPYARRMYFERTLAFMNAHGARPVIVINPIHPAVLAVLKKDGFAARRAAALEYLNRLQRRLDFVVVECEDIGTWGGSTDDFLNATHINSRNMKRMLEYVVAHSDGALA